MITRPRPPHADPYTPRPYGAPRDPSTVPAPARSMFHRRDAVPGTVGAAARVTASPRTGTPRLVPMRDTVPLRTYEHTTRMTRDHGHTATVDHDGFVVDVHAFTGPAHVDTVERDTDGARHVMPAPHVPTGARRRHAMPAVGDTDMRNACDTHDGRPVDGNGRYVRTVGDDASWTAHTSTLAPRRRPRPAAAAAPRVMADRTPPARVTRDVVVMWVRASGYAGPVDARMIALARDAMAAQRQRDAYADA